VLAVLLSRSVAGLICLGVAAVLLAGSAMIRRPTLVVLGGAVAVVLNLGLTVAIARGANPAGLGGRAAERRELWTAADKMVAARPVRGVGPGRFEVLSSVSSDADLRWAHHGYLQIAAETGLVGLALLLTLLGWVYGRLALAALGAPFRAARTAAAVTLVALHATVDHVLHDPAVILTLATLVGAATARSALPALPGAGPTARHPHRTAMAAEVHRR
jgi:O-antigen ligase